MLEATRETREEQVLPRAREDRFPRSAPLVQILDHWRHTPNSGDRVVKPRWLWTGLVAAVIGFIGFAAFIATPSARWLEQLIGTTGLRPTVWLLVSFAALVGGTVVAIGNYPDDRYRVASERIERWSWLLRVGTLLFASVSFAVSGVVSAVLIVAGPWELQRFGSEGVSSAEDARYVVLAMAFASVTLFGISVMIVTSLSTHPLVSIRHTGYLGLGRGVSWQSLLMRLSGALLLLAGMASLVRLFADPLPSGTSATLAITLTSVAFVLAGRHAAEIRRRRSRAVELLDEVAVSLGGRLDEPGIEAYRSLVARLERESLLGQGAWWWFPEQELFDHLLLDLLRVVSAEPADVPDRDSVGRLRSAHGSEVTAKSVRSLVADLRDNLLLVDKRAR